MIFDGLKRLFGRGDEAAAQPDPCAGQPEMISCKEAVTRLQEFVDGELTGLTHEQVEAHFEVCTRCYPHLKMEQAFRQKVQTALSQPEVPGDLRDRVLQLLTHDVEGEG